MKATLKWLPENLKGVIGILTVILVFGYLYGITFFNVKLPHDIVPQVLIAIVAFGKDIYNYFFGSSQGANKKDELLAEKSSSVAVTNHGDVLVDNTKKQEDEIKG